MKARDIMAKEFPSISPEATIKEAVNMLKGVAEEERFRVHGRGILLVINGKGNLVGILTVSDILRAIVPFYMELMHLSELTWEGLFEKMCHKIENKKVKDLMTKEVFTIHDDANLMEIAELMAKKRLRCLPVIKEGKVIGMVSLSDIFYLIVKTMLEEKEAGGAI